MGGGRGAVARGGAGASMLVLALLTAPAAALAQGAPVAAAQRNFIVPAGSLSAALVVFGRQAGVQISYVPSLAAGARTDGVSGSMSVETALTRLLAGSGLTHVFQGSTVVIRGPATAAGNAPGGAIELDTIDVAGDGTDGFVATRTDAGTKTNTPILEVPQSISVVTRAELDVRNVQTDAEALTYTPGIYAQPFGGAQNQQNPYYIIRGFPSAQGGSYVDGLISFINYRYEPYGYSRYDVVRGPSSSLYGQSDPGGLVNRVSKMPTEETFREIQLQGGNFDRLQGAFDFGGAINEDKTLLYRLTGLYRNADAPITYDYGITSPDERQYIAPALTWKPNEDTTITFLGNYLKDKIGQENSFMWPGTQQLTHLAILPSDYGVWNQEQYALGYLLEHNFTDNLTFRQNLRYSHMDSTIRSGWVWDVTDGWASRVVDGNDERRTDLVIDNQIQYDLQTGPVSHAVLAGFDYQNTSDWIAFVDNWDAPPLNIFLPNYTVPLPEPTPWQSVTYTGESYGLYLQDQLKFGDGWIVTLGGRQDWVHGRSVGYDLYSADPLIDTTSDDQKFTYRAGVTYLFDSGLAPYASYATSFLPQSGVDAYGNALKPTTGEQIEAGLKFQPIGWNAMFTAAVFELTKQNVPTPYGEDPYGPVVQDGEIRSRGVELQATVSRNGWNLNASYTYNDVVVTEANPDVPNSSLALGKHPRWVPEHMGSLWIDYTFSSGRLAGLNLGAGVRYVGTTYANATNTIANDPYTLVDAVVRYDLAKLWPQMKGAELAVNATNLLGTQYVTCFSAADCKWGAQRTVIGTLTYRW